MNKKIKLALSCLFVTTLLAGCGESTEQSSEPTSEEHHDPVTLTYAAWNLGAKDSETPNLDRMMLEAFEKQYPWITVDVLERPKVAGTEEDTNWNEFLSSRAAIKKLPDVFLADTIPTYVSNGWVRNLNDLIANDAEYQSLSDDVKNAAVYDGITMALPISIYYHGYVVDETLFDKQNGDAPTATSSWVDFLDEIKACAEHKTGGNGIAGLSGIEHIIHYYPSLLNDSYQWFTFDGEKFNLDSKEFTDTMNFYLDVRNDATYCFDGVDAEQKIDFFGSGSAEDLINNQQILASWYGSYSLGALQAKIDSGEWAGRKLDFIGIPSGKDANGNTIKKTMASMDFNVISNTTKHPEEAYLLAKWMGFGKDGYAKRLELSTSTEGIDPLNFAPLIPDAELLDSFFALYPGWDEYRKVVESQSFVIESLKFQVGYNECRYKGTYDSEFTMFDIIAQLLDGTKRIADISQPLNKRINEIFNESNASFETNLDKYYK